jgi:hypothetical protein
MMHPVKAIRVVELRHDDRGDAQGDQPVPILVGKSA